MILNKAEKEKNGLKDFIGKKKPTTVKDLVKKGKVETLELNDVDLKNLKRELNKSGVKFSIKKDLTTGNNIIFFQAKDEKVMEQAFKEAVAKFAGKDKKKESVIDKLNHFREKVKNTPQKDKIKEKHKEQSLQEGVVKTKIVKEILKDIKNIFHIRDKKKFVIKNLPYLFFFYLANIFSRHINSYVGGDYVDKMIVALSDIGTLSYLPSFHIDDLFAGICFSAVIWLIVYQKKKNAKKFRQGVEYGSARWGGPKDIEPYLDERFDNNILLTNTERLTMNSRPKNPKFARNKNVLVVGGSGSGKTRFFLKPNLMQMHSSYVVTDPKGLTFQGQRK